MSDPQGIPSGFLRNLESALRGAGISLIGKSIGAYEIGSLIGVGGMGEVYRARDTKLGRDVAIKVLPPEFASDRDRLARFEREARVLASLNHPHIATIHGFEDASGVPALVMELVDGDTLGERIARGPIPVRDALVLAAQIADALDAAHEHGITHRDLKPANVKVRPDGTVKVLDFGLAKATVETASHHDATESGRILGTAAYMSPEQARGQRVDKRADIWAFGAVLYEMLTSRRAFSGESVSDTLAAVLEREPDWSALPASTPPFVRRVLERCLEKDPRRRLRDIADARHELAEPGPAAVIEPGSSRRWWNGAAVSLATIAVTLAGVGVWQLAHTRGADRVTQFRMVLPSAGLSTAVGRQVSISRDGRFLVYNGDRNGRSQLFVHPLDQLDPIPIAGTEGQAGGALISPDGKWVAYYDAGTHSLMKVPITGGTPEIVYKWQGAGFFGGSYWGRDDTIVFTNPKTGGLMHVSAKEGSAIELTAPADEFHYQPFVVPRGRVVVFTINRHSVRSTIAAVRLDGGPFTALVEGSSPRVTANGYLLFIRDGGIWAAKFDQRRLTLTTPPVVVVGGLEWFATFNVAENSTLVYTPTQSGRTPVWVDRQGAEEPLAVPPQTYQNPRISRDGSRVILDVRDIRDVGDIWVFDRHRPNLNQLTAMNGNKRHAIWSPDGTRIYFSFVDAQRLTEGASAPTSVGPFFLYSQRADGTGHPERVFESPGLAQYPLSFTPDGTRLVLREMGGLRGEDWNLRLLTLADRTLDPLLVSGAYETNGDISPDGKWLAYESEESPRREVYVRPFPDVHAARWQISTNGGREPLWSRDGRELFYLGPDGRLMRVEVKTEPTFSASTPVRLLNKVYMFRSLSDTPARSYDILPDGSRFLMIKEPSTELGPQLVVALNWAATLEK